MTRDQIEQLHQFGLATPEELAVLSTPRLQQPESPVLTQQAPSSTTFATLPSAGPRVSDVSLYPASSGYSYDSGGNLIEPTPSRADLYAGIGLERQRVLGEALHDSMQQQRDLYNQQQAKIKQANEVLANREDYSDEQIANAYRARQQPLVRQPPPDVQISMDDVKSLFPEGTDENILKAKQQQLQIDQDIRQRNYYLATLPTTEQYVPGYFDPLKGGPSWQALQQLGIQYPGTGRSAPVFKPDIPTVQRADLISGTPGHPGPAQKIQPAQPVTAGTTGGQASNVPLVTTIGSEFGEVDNPASPHYQGYTEQGAGVGARGANLFGEKTEGVALPTNVVSKYVNASSSNAFTDFNSKYDIQVIDPKTGKYVSAPLVDYGPGKSTGAGIDLLMGTRNNLGLPINFKGAIGYRIVPKGSAPPDNAVPSVQQTAQTAQTQDVTSGQFGQGTIPNTVTINQLDASDVRDPSIHGQTMTNAEIAKWARVKTDEIAGMYDDAGVPMTVKEYKEQLQKYVDAGTKYQEAKEDLKPIPQQWNDSFNSAANLVTPSFAVTDDKGQPVRDQSGQPVMQSQLQQLKDLWVEMKKAPSLAALEWFKLTGKGIEIPANVQDQRVRNYMALALSLAPNIAKGLQGQVGNLSEQEQANALNLLPTKFDDEASAMAKLQRIEDMSRRQMKNNIDQERAQYYDASGHEQIYRNAFVTHPTISAQARAAGATDVKNQLLGLQKPAVNPSAPAPPQPAQPAQPTYRSFYDRGFYNK